MKRKVIQLAHKTLVVSLPSKWVKKYNVTKGGELDAEERGQQMVFSTMLNSDSERIKVDFSELNSEVIRRWVLASLHKSGYDEIEITYNDPSVIRVVQETIRDLLTGFAIVEQGKNRCIIRVVAEEQEKEFETVLRRAFLVVRNMGEGMYDYARENRLERLKELLVLEKTNNQLTNFCERILNKRGYPDHKRTCFAYVVAWNLEKVCDNYKEICELLSANPKARISGAVTELIKAANDYFGRYYELYYKFDINRLTEMDRERNALRKKASEMLRSSRGADTAVLCSLKDFVEKVSDFSASFIALKLRN